MTRAHVIWTVGSAQPRIVPFTPEEEAAADAAEAAANNPANFPLTMRQLRLGLKELAGKPASFLLDTINAIPDSDEHDRALIWYEETSVVEWNHPMTQKLIDKAGFTPEQAAAMWMQAKDIPA